jgi:hypothetical protein
MHRNPSLLPAFLCHMNKSRRDFHRSSNCPLHDRQQKQFDGWDTELTQPLLSLLLHPSSPYSLSNLSTLPPIIGLVLMFKIETPLAMGLLSKKSFSGRNLLVYWTWSIFSLYAQPNCPFLTLGCKLMRLVDLAVRMYSPRSGDASLLWLRQQTTNQQVGRTIA